MSFLICSFSAIRMLALALGLALPAPDGAPEAPIDADVLIQAGHEGRPDCRVEPVSLCRNTGAAAAPGEIVWTPIVADEATRILRSAGVNVLRKQASMSGSYRVRAAVFIHFDASVRPCDTKASVGYPSDAASAKFADRWKALYGGIWPYGFEPDNFTTNLSKYYAYRHVSASRGMFVLEAGDMSCPAQHDWLARRLQWEGRLLAYFLSTEVGRGNVPFPAAVSK